MVACTEKNTPDTPIDPSNPTDPTTPTTPTDPSTPSKKRLVKSVYTKSYNNGSCDTLSYVKFQYDNKKLTNVTIGRYDKSVTDYTIKNFGTPSMTIESNLCNYGQFIFSSDGKHIVQYVMADESGSHKYDIEYSNGQRLKVTKTQDGDVEFTEDLRYDNNNCVEVQYMYPQYTMSYDIEYSDEVNTNEIYSYWNMSCLLPPNTEYAAQWLTGLFGLPSKNLIKSVHLYTITEGNKAGGSVNYVGHRYDSRNAIWYDVITGTEMTNDSNVVETSFYEL